MCNDCYKIQRPDQIINGCCILTPGYYCIWDITHMTLACEEWVELCDLYNVIRQISHITFNVVAERQRARNTLNNMKREAPFHECKRFPWRKTYVNISCSVYGTLFQNLLGALDYKDRETEKELRYGKDNKQDDSGQSNSASSSIDDAKTAYRNNLKNIQNELCKRNEVFDRIKFETKYDLTWCAGECPREPGAPIPPPNNPPPNNPPDNPPGNPPDPNQRTYGDLMKLLEGKGLRPSDYNVFTEADILKGDFKCSRVLQTLGDTLKTKALPKGIANVYIFTKGEYSNCGSIINPTKGYIYRPQANRLSEEMNLIPAPDTVPPSLDIEEQLKSPAVMKIISDLIEAQKTDTSWRKGKWPQSRLSSRHQSPERFENIEHRSL
jgi:hypothetical protein